MGCGNPPAMAAREEGLHELSLSTRPSGVDDGSRSHGSKSFGASTITSPSISWGYAHFPPQYACGDWQSYPTKCENDSNHLGGHMNLSFSNVSKTDESLINIKRDLSEFHREPGLLYPDLSMSELRHAAHGHNTVSAGCSMDATVSSMDFKPDVHMNFLSPRCETGASYPIREHGAEAKNMRIGRSQIDGKFSSAGDGTSALPLMDNFGIPRNENDINIIPVPLSTQKVDGNFLTLGIGGGQEIRSNSHFSTQEIASKLEDIVPSQRNTSYVRQSPNNFAQLTGRPAGVQTNYGGLSSLAGNLAGTMSTHDEDRLTVNTSARLNSIPFLGFQTPQAYAQPNWLPKNDNSVFDPIPLSLPFGNTPVFQHERVYPNPLGSEITRSTKFSSQPISQKQVHYRTSSINVSSESPRNYPSDWYRGSSLNHAQQGTIISPTEGSGARSGAGVHFQPLGHLHTSQDVRAVESHWNRDFPERIRVPIPSGSTFQSSDTGPFPRRLGVQPTDFATIQTTTDYLRRPIRPPFAFGPPPMASQANAFSPSLPSGQQQHHGMPTLSRVFPRVDYSSGQAIVVPKFDVQSQASPIISRPSLKRQATENPPAASSAHRRKIFPQPVISHSTPHKKQPIPAPIPAAVHIPPSPLHVKWQGFQEPLKPTGEKCHLCNRDLSFTPEGPVHQPANPPAVAVLPCGHTFHDHCLQIITPEDQSKNPPCIPCAIGET